MFEGTVRWFDHVEGFGVIMPDAEGPDLFVESTDVIGGSLREEDRVSYTTGDRSRGVCAINVVRRA